MALNFPDSPTLNQIYTDSVSGFSYQWNGTVWISFTPSDIGNIKVLDDISGSFNGSTQTFALTSSAIAISPASPQAIIVNLGGVVQDPSDDYTISGSNIIFSTPPTSGLSFSGVVLGFAVPVGVSTGDAYYRQVYSPTGVQTSFSFVNGYTVGYLDVYHNGAKLVPTADYTATDGLNFSLITPAQAGDDVEAVGYRVSTLTIVDGALNSLTVSGIATIAGATNLGSTLNVTGSANLGSNLNVTGITTLGTVGAAGTSLLVNGNARVTGILTVGTGSITLNGSTDIINVGTGLTLSSGGITAGVITATSFVGDGSGLTGIISPLTVSSFNPANSATGVGYTSNIVITYNTPVTTGLGTITLRTGSATGPIVESFDAQSSNRITVNQAVVTIDPITTFDSLTNYYLVVPSGAIVSNNNIGLAITTYNFTSQQVTRNAFGWGTNQSGDLAQNNVTSYSSPVQIPGTSWTSISNGSNHGLATKFDKTLWTWGQNNRGNLGQNNTTNYSSPVQIPGTTWSSISAGYRQALATKTDGTLWAWGFNQFGQLGQNNLTYYSSPVQIPGTTWSSIGAGGYHVLATKTDGTLWVWGYNNTAQLGQNNRTNYSSPVQIPGTTWSSIGANGSHSLATKTDGTLWSWGQNNRGQLGQNNRVYYSSPVQIPGTTWSSVADGSLNSGQSFATKTDRTLWSWGYNYYGQLGQNNRTQYSSPVQIPGTTWSSIDGGNSHALATKTDGTLWTWGLNQVGELGQNNRTDYSSPVQIPGTTWSSISAGSNNSLATTLVLG